MKDCPYHFPCRLPHIVRQELAVRPRIGGQLFLIKALEVFQRFLCGEAENAVGVTLQGGKVIKFGRGYRLFLFYHGDDLRLPAPAFFQHFLRLFPVIHAPCRCLHPTAGNMDRKILLFLKIPDLFLPLHKHGKGGRLHPAHRQLLKVFRGISPRGVHAYQPVRFRPAHGSLADIPVLCPVFQVRKALPDCRILHGTDPQAFYRKGASRKVVYMLKYKFPFPACVTGIDHVLQILPVKQFLQDRKLCFFILCHSQLPFLRDNRQV